MILNDIEAFRGPTELVKDLNSMQMFEEVSLLFFILSNRLFTSITLLSTELSPMDPQFDMIIRVIEGKVNNQLNNFLRVCQSYLIIRSSIGLFI